MGRSKAVRILELAKDAGVELDDALVLLWDAGMESVEETTVLAGGDLRQAKRLLGIPSAKQVRSPRFWRETLGLAKDEFVELLGRLEISMHPKARKLPKGAVAKLRRESRSRNMPIVAESAPPAVEPAPRTAQCEERPFEFTLVGKERPLVHLSYEDALTIHSTLVEDFKRKADPIEPPGVKSETNLSSALFRPATAMGDELKYPTVETAGAALLHSMVLNHPFHNGNKRTALVSLLVFLDKNGLVFTCNQDQLFKLVLRVAQHKLVPRPRTAAELADREVCELSQWVFDNSRALEHGERPLPFRKLRQILTGYECTESYGKGGSRVTFEREAAVPGFLGLKMKRVTLKSHVKYSGDGREVNRNTISKLRGDLWLDDAHGKDSKQFYGSEESSIDDFIVEYRRTLDRLAKL